VQRPDKLRKPWGVERPVFVLVIQAEPGVEPIRAVRALLKVMLRAFGLRGLRIRYVVRRP
jgi:hypothetical protein